jgi:AraC family transcriptional regulator
MDKHEAQALRTQKPVPSHVASQFAVNQCSVGRGWRGIEVWHQTCTVPQEIILPPMVAHHVIAQRHGTAHIAQRREGQVHSACWRSSDLALIPAGEPSAWQIKGEPDLVHIDLDCELVNRAVQETFDRGMMHIALNNVMHANDPEIGLLANMLLRELSDHPVNGSFYAESLANVLAILIASKYSNLSLELPSCYGGLPKPILKRCIDYVQANLEAHLSLDQLAKQAGYSAWHFARLFKESTGIAPHRFVMNQRIELAKQLLRTTDLSKAEIALRVGFVDQSHLARVFKANAGLSPAEYCQQNTSIK